MRTLLLVVVLMFFPLVLAAQGSSRFPPDSLINTRIIPRGTPVTRVIGMMRDFAGDLGVRCQFCHVGEEGMPLEQFDFASDARRTKLVAREMMAMMAEINRRVDSLPGDSPRVAVTCETCHRGVSRPVPLPTIVTEAAVAAGSDSSIRAYRALRERHYGRSAYDFGEPTLNIAALRLARNARYQEALAIVGLNEEFFPRSAGVAVVRGNVLLLRGDTAAAVSAYREALDRDSTSGEARNRLRALGAAGR